MALFRKKSSEPVGVIGIDIGAGGVKMVELASEKSRMRLLTYGYAEQVNLENQGNLLDDPKQAGKLITDIMKESGMKATRANASLPSHSVFHTIITIPRPASEKEDIKPMIERQVEKLLPMPIDQMVLDSIVLDKQEEKKDKKKKDHTPEAQQGSSKNMRVLVSGAPKELVNKYVEVFKNTKLQLTSLETEAFALIRSLIGNDKSRIMLVDIGYERTNISIVQDGVPFLHRSIKAGGMNVTNVIARQMGISQREAEQMKMDLAEERGGELPPSLKEAMQPILHEIKYSLELYAQQETTPHTTVEKIIITGGSAHLPQIDSYLTEVLNINVYLGDPWARVANPTGLRPVLDEIGPRFSVAIGLAMKDLEKSS